MNREDWLNEIAKRMAPRFEALGHPLPPYRIAIGFTSRGKRSAVIGECWDARASADKHHEILIRPDQAEPMSVAATLAHELAHAAVGLKEGHKGKFATVVLALGLQRPLTATTAGQAFIDWVQPILDDIGPLPHGRLSWPSERRAVPAPAPGDDGEAHREEDGGERDSDGDSDGEGASSAPPKQSTRLRKVECTDCGYTVRVTQKWLDVGKPHCPQHGPMEEAD